MLREAGCITLHVLDINFYSCTIFEECHVSRSIKQLTQGQLEMRTSIYLGWASLGEQEFTTVSRRPYNCTSLSPLGWHHIKVVLHSITKTLMRFLTILSTLQVTWLLKSTTSALVWRTCTSNSSTLFSALGKEHCSKEVEYHYSLQEQPEWISDDRILDAIVSYVPFEDLGLLSLTSQNR